jgi:hypothetical protein
VPRPRCRRLHSGSAVDTECDGGTGPTLCGVLGGVDHDHLELLRSGENTGPAPSVSDVPLQSRVHGNEVGDVEQLGGVDVLGGEPCSERVVLRGHDLHAEAGRVGVDHTWCDEHRLTRCQHDVVEEQRDENARVLGLSRRECLPA